MKINQIKVGAVLSYLSMGLSTVISLVYTPIMIARLGDSEYGVYNLVLPIISYLNLLSFGLGSAYVRYYSRFKVEDNRQGMARISRTDQHHTRDIFRMERPQTQLVAPDEAEQPVREPKCCCHAKGYQQSHNII